MPLHKPPHLPADAHWDHDSWVAGEKNAGGAHIGTWARWREDGTLLCVEEWGDGQGVLTYQQFHPDGTLAQEGRKDLQRNIWLGTIRWLRGPQPTLDDVFFAPGSRAHAVEWEFDEAGHIIGKHIFDAQGKALDTNGNPLPPRPASLPPDAFFDTEEDGWVQGRYQLGEKHQKLGEFLVWDREGRLIRREQHEPNGDSLISIYRLGVEPPMVRTSTLNRCGQRDRTRIFYDMGGGERFRLRLEVVRRHHVRRYWNEHLVFEAVWSDDPEEPPQRVHYFEQDGTLFLDYVSARNGGGLWRYHAAGEIERVLPETQEVRLNRHGLWDRFLRSFDRCFDVADDALVTTDPEQARQRFLSDWRLAAQRQRKSEAAADVSASAPALTPPVELPTGLTYGMTQSQVHALLGTPDEPVETMERWRKDGRLIRVVYRHKKVSFVDLAPLRDDAAVPQDTPPRGTAEEAEKKKSEWPGE
jgi:hypothetical protein